MNRKDFIDECLKARETIISELKVQLEGPGADGSIPDAEHEIITDIPSKRYSCGILYPQQVTLETEDTDDTGEINDTVISEANTTIIDGNETSEEKDKIDSNVEIVGENKGEDDNDTIDLRNQWC